MTRNCILLMVVTVCVGFTPAWLYGPSTVAWGQPATETFGATSEGWILRENFDDNRKSTLWQVYQEDPNCNIAEVDKHLEFTAAADVNDAFAGYVGRDWWIDPNHDFTMKATLHHDLVTLDGAWISFGLTTDPEQPRDQYVSLGIGCANRYRNYWHEWKDGYELRSDFASRVQNSVTLYISYNAWDDELYLSDTGYGSEDAWQVFPDMVKWRWNRKPLFVSLGGNVDRAKIDPDHLYLDDFVIESGMVVKLGQPTDPEQPTDPNDPGGYPPGGVDVDLVVPVFITPSSMIRSATTAEFTAMASLPKEIGLADIDLTESLTLLPAQVVASRQTAFLTLTGNTVAMAAFSVDELLAAVDDGLVELQLVGRLTDGRQFGGTQTVTIKTPVQ